MIQRDWNKTILLASTVVCLYLVVSTRSTLWDRDEPRFARATMEMVESGNYLYPTFNGQLRPDKPILIYWLMSIPVRLLGPTELACRFFSGLGTGLTCILTFIIGRSLFGTTVGLGAMAILATSFMMMYLGTAATVDAVLLPCMMAALAVFVRTRDRCMHWKDVILMGLALGLALLTKGPVGLLPIVVIVAALGLSRTAKYTRWRYILPLLGAVTIGAIMFLAWAIPANQATKGEFARIGLGKHVMGRSLAPMEGHGGRWLLSLPYYCPILIAFFFPWSMHLPGAISALIGRRIGDQTQRALLWAWLAPVFILMSVVATKLPHYILLMWPAMAILVSETLRQAEQGTLAERDVLWLRRGRWFFGPVAFGLAGVLAAIGWFLKVEMLKWTGPLAAIVLVVMAVAAIRYQRAGRFTASSKVLVAGMMAFLIPLLFGVLPGLERIKVSPPLAYAICSQTGPEVPVATYKYGEPTLNFYVGRRIEVLSADRDVADWAGRSGPGVLVVPRDDLDAVQQKCGRLPAQILDTVKGYNYSKGKPMEILVLRRGGDGR